MQYALNLEGKRDGFTFTSSDLDRLNKQAKAVFNVICDGEWYTLDQIAFCAHAPQASVSARLRDLRKPRFGGFVVQRKNMGGGVFHYRLVDR
jgi:histidinol phosphatase-like enzyme